MVLRRTILFDINDGTNATKVLLDISVWQTGTFASKFDQLRKKPDLGMIFEAFKAVITASS